MKLGELVTVTAFATGVALGAFVDSADAFLPPGSGWQWGSVTNAGNSPNPGDDQQNIGFDLLLEKNNQVINSTQQGNQFIFKNAIENFFYKSECGNNPEKVEECDPFDSAPVNSFNISFDVGDLIASANGNNIIEYTIASSNIQRIINGELRPTVNQDIATFKLTIPDDGLSLRDIQDTVEQFYDEQLTTQNGNLVTSGNINVEITEAFKLDGGTAPARGAGENLTLLNNKGELNGDGKEGGTFSFRVLNPKTTPESSTTISILALGLVGTGILVRRKVRQF